MSDPIERQKSLPHADWRFLLPPPSEGAFRHLVLLGGPPRLAARLVEVGLARRVSRTIPAEQSADAVVILHDADVRLDAARSCLVPGGVLYWEIARGGCSWLGMTPGRVRRQLLEVDLVPTGAYWLRPNFTECHRYLPVDAGGALRWYLETWFTVSLLQRVLGPVLRLSVPLSVRSLPLPGICYAVTATAGHARAARPAILACGHLPISLREQDLRLLMLNRGGDDDMSRRVIVFPFATRGIQPLAVLKFWRLPNRNVDTEREQTTLAAIRRSLDDSMRRTIPEPLGMFNMGQLAVGIESYARGRSLALLSARRGTPIGRKIADLDLLVSWISEFHRQASLGRPPWNDAQRRRWVEGPLSAYTEVFGTKGGEDRLFAEVRQRAVSLMGTPLPIVWVHWDLTTWNIFRDGRDIAVIDWAGAGPGLPLFDLLYLVTRWSHAVRRLGGAQAKLDDFRGLFLGGPREDVMVASVHRAIDRYLTRIEVDRRFFPMLLVILWVVRAVERLDPTQAVAYVRALAEHPEHLFARSLWT
ncbi:MAG: hypothetical protein DMD79_03165 [Candidatus Rokuibacteriota bacterium]|nr:MAG: hypothetical protein DMD79_03165 [Candidatus Rokubacteria bacterium]